MGIMGIDFGQVMGLMGDVFALVAAVLAANANSGIGIGFHIEFVAAEAASLGLP